MRSRSIVAGLVGLLWMSGGCSTSPPPNGAQQTADGAAPSGPSSPPSSDGGSGTSGSGTSGSDGGSTSVDAGTATGGGAALGQSCSPTATPVGKAACEYVPNVTLFDCSGNPVELHSLCGASLSYVYTFTEWCPNCTSFATNGANSFYSQYKASIPGFEMRFVLTETGTGGKPGPADCARVRNAFGLTMPVLYDRDGVLESKLGMRVNSADLVVRAGGKIVINGPWAEFTVRTALEGGYGDCLK